MSEAKGTGWDRQAEVETLLNRDTTVLGRLWMYERQGFSPQQMAEAEGTETAGWVSNYRWLVRVLRDGEIPKGPALALQGARKVRAWLRLNDLTPDLRKALIEQESLLMSRAEDKQALTEEAENALAATEKAESDGPPGIYVYTLPHYLRYRSDPETGRTLLKVGHSSRDAIYRVRSQGRLAALPEDPILLRIYPVEASRNAEKDFHDWLRDADHPGGRSQRGGSEWFTTSTKFLDRIARSKGLEVRVVTNFEVGDD